MYATLSQKWRRSNSNIQLVSTICTMQCYTQGQHHIYNDCHGFPEEWQHHWLWNKLGDLRVTCNISGNNSCKLIPQVIKTWVGMRLVVPCVNIHEMSQWKRVTEKHMDPEDTHLYKNLWRKKRGKVRGGAYYPGLRWYSVFINLQIGKFSSVW